MQSIIKKYLCVDASFKEKNESNESRVCVEMVDKALLIADRGYEGYNLIAHCQEKGGIFLFVSKTVLTELSKAYLFRIKRILTCQLHCIFPESKLMNQKSS